MINHVSLNAILCDIDNKNQSYRNIRIIRSYKNKDGRYLEDVIKCMMWTKNNKNSLFSYKSGSLVSIDGRIETVDNDVVIIVESMTLLCGNYVDYHTRAL